MLRHSRKAPIRRRGSPHPAGHRHQPWIAQCQVAVASVIVALAAASLSAQRPPVSGRTAAVSTGHPLTSAAALDTLLRGGNAFDAGVTALLVGGVVEQDLYGLGGEALILVYPNAERRVTSIVGQGWAPKRATLAWYRTRNRDLFGEGLDPAVVPGALHGALTVLERWGTMSFEQVSSRAIDYAEHGFPLRPLTARAIEANLEFVQAWPDNRRAWLKPDGTLYTAGETIRFPALAATLARMVDAEREASRLGRAEGITAARDRFYKGDIAAEMVAFLQRHDAPFDATDFAEFFAKIEEPTRTDYRGYTVYKQGFGSQGPVLLQTLNILETFDLRSMGHNSPDYLHTLVEAMKLAYADRDTYYADPEFVEVPAIGLLSKSYGAARASTIDRARLACVQGRRSATPRPPGGYLALLGRGPRGRLGHGECAGIVRAVRRGPEGYNAHRRHRRGRQRLR